MIFLELSCFFNDSADAGSLISGSSAFSKTSLNIWKFTVHVSKLNPPKLTISWNLILKTHTPWHVWWTHIWSWPWTYVKAYIQKSFILNNYINAYSIHSLKTPKYLFWKIFPQDSRSSIIFSYIDVWMWELDHKESWALMNWCFWTVALEKTLESPLDCKEIQPVHPKGNQSWVFIGRTDAKAETPALATWFE